MRRFKGLTSAFSRKMETHAAAISFHFMFKNFARPHTNLPKLAGPRNLITPAIGAGVANHVWSVREIAALLD